MELFNRSKEEQTMFSSLILIKCSFHMIPKGLYFKKWTFVLHDLLSVMKKSYCKRVIRRYSIIIEILQYIKLLSLVIQNGENFIWVSVMEHGKSTHGFLEGKDSWITVTSLKSGNHLHLIKKLWRDMKSRRNILEMYMSWTFIARTRHKKTMLYDSCCCDVIRSSQGVLNQLRPILQNLCQVTTISQLSLIFLFYRVQSCLGLYRKLFPNLMLWNFSIKFSTPYQVWNCSVKTENNMSFM